MDRGGTERPPDARCVKSGGGADRCICASCNRVRAANRRQDTKWEARRDGVCRPATQHCVGLKGCRLSRGACHRRIASWGAVLFVLCSICLPRCASPVSHERDCPSSSSRISALLLQKKGPESFIFETNISSGGVTGIRKALKLHDHPFGGLAVDPVRQMVHVLTGPSSVVHNLELGNEDVSYLGNSSIYEEILFAAGQSPDQRRLIARNRTCSSSDASCAAGGVEVEPERRNVRNVWNLAAWEGPGLLLAIMPRDLGFNTSVLLLDPLTGQAVEEQVCHGSPVRGIFAFDRRREHYYFLTASKKQRSLVGFQAPTRSLSVWTLPLNPGELIGLHHDEAKCRLLAVGLISPGVLIVLALDLSRPSIRTTEVATLSEATGTTIKAFELVGMTSLVAGRDGTFLLCQDPRTSTINVFNLDTGEWYALDIAGQGIVAVQALIRLDPRVSSIAPLEVGMAGSTLITVSGVDFGRADTSPHAYIGTTPSLEVNWISDSTIMVRTPSSPLKSAKLPFHLEFAGRGISTSMQLDYVPSWKLFHPTLASVAGGQVVSLHGSRFGGGQFECKFGDQSSEGRAHGTGVVTCPVPARSQPAGFVQLDLFNEGILIKRDTEQKFLYVAGDAVGIAISPPTFASGGRFFELHAELQDSQGNPVLSYGAFLRLRISEWSAGSWSELPVVAGSIESVQGDYMEVAEDGAATFRIAIARHGSYQLNVSTEACHCGESGCSEDEVEWDGGFGRCETYGQGGINDFADSMPCIWDNACEPCACRCADVCGFAGGDAEISAYGICAIDSSEFADSRRLRPMVSSCLVRDAIIQVAVGQMASLRIAQAPDRSLAAHLLIPQPRIEILDSGGNLANVLVTVTVSINGAASSFLRASPVSTSAGVAIFTDVKISLVGSYRLIFSTQGGLEVSKMIQILHSSPTSLFNAGLYPSRSHVSMQAMLPAPIIWILDQGENRIDEGLYWIQDSFGVIASQALNITIRASLSSVYANVTLHQSTAHSCYPLCLPGEVEEPSGRLYGATTISLLGPTTGVALDCTLNCSGHGQCQRDAGLELCRCQSGWRGAGCQLPHEGLTCGEDCDSGLGWWSADTCSCLPESLSSFGVQQLGSQALFSEMMVDSAGKGFTVIFSAEGLMPVESFAFAVEHGAANHLYVVAHPINGTGGQGLRQASVVEIRDAGKNLVQSSTHRGERNVSVHLVGNVNSTLAGKRSHPAAQGRAIFSDLIVDLISGGEPYRLEFTSEGLLPAYSTTFDVFPGSPHMLNIVQQPDGARAGLPLARQPQVEILDPGGNRVPASGSYASGWTLSILFHNVTVHGSLNVPFTTGLAHFTDIRLDTLGPTFITFDTGRNLPRPIDSLPFNVTTGPPAQVHVVVQPGGGVGGVLKRQPSILITDAGGNLAEESVNVTVSAKGNMKRYLVGIYDIGTNVFNFTDLEVIAPAPNEYQLVFEVNGIGFLTHPFNISVGSPVKLLVSVQPNSSLTAGAAFEPQLEVAVVDRAGNLVTQDGILISVVLNVSLLSKYQNPFVSDLAPVASDNNSWCSTSETGYGVMGAITAATSSGKAVFSDLAVGVAGVGARLIFESIMLQSVQSQLFEVTLGLVASSLSVLCSPLIETGGDPFLRQPILQILDRGGNRMHGQNFTASASVLSPSPLFPAFLAGSLRSKMHGDLLTFTNLALDTAGEGFRLRFDAPQLHSVTTNPFVIVVGAAVGLNIDSITAIRVYEQFNVTVSTRDSGGNPTPLHQPLHVSAHLFSIYTRSVVSECRGLHSCDSNLNLSLPSGSELLSARISVNMSCTDFDSPNEHILAVRVGSHELNADTEYEKGPWEGCFRDCIDTRRVVFNYDAVRRFCWDSRQMACTRLLYRSTWDGQEPRWNFLARLVGETSPMLSLHIQVPETVNFNPCDGNFVNAVAEVELEYLVKDVSGRLSGQNQALTTPSSSSVTFSEFSLPQINRRFMLGFTAEGLQQAFSDPFMLNPGQVKSFNIVQQPGNGTGGSILHPQPILELVDFGGNRAEYASGATYSISAQLMSQCSASASHAAAFLSNPSLGRFDGTAISDGAHLGGSTSIHPSQGLVVFTDLLVSAQFDEYNLLFTLEGEGPLSDLGSSEPPQDTYIKGSFFGMVDGYVVCRDCACSDADRPCIPCGGPQAPGVSEVSSAFSVSRGRPYALLISVEPGNRFGPTSPGGEPLDRQPEIKVIDFSGNVHPDLSGTLVTAAIEDNGGISGRLTGVMIVPVTAGTAVFTNLTIDMKGDMYTLVFSSSGLASVSSQPFNIAVGSPQKLAMIRQPSNGKRNFQLNVQPAVAVQDRAGNTISDWQEDVILVSLSGGSPPWHPRVVNNVLWPPSANPELSGTFEGYLYRGAAYWHNLRVDVAGIDYVLVFSAPGLEGCASEAFSIVGSDLTVFRWVVMGGNNNPAAPTIARSFLFLPEVVVVGLDADENVADVGLLGDFVSLEVVLESGSTAKIMQMDDVEWFNGGVAVFKNIIVSTAASEVIAFKISIFSDDYPSQDNFPYSITMIDPFTGWWNMTFAGQEVQLSLRGHFLQGSVLGEWKDASSNASFFLNSDDAPLYETRGALSAGNFALSTVLTFTSKNADGSQAGGGGSIYLEQCTADAIVTGHISSRTSQFDSPEASWSRDVQFFEIEEHYPQHHTSYFVAIANSFNESIASYTADSALYKWQDGKLQFYQGFENTKSAFSMRHFQMGQAHYMMIANHFDDGGNGYGAPSVLYRYMWVENKYQFVPVQSIGTEGAVAWEQFEVVGETYMVVANFFNGSHFAIKSNVYRIVRNNPDSVVPVFRLLQSISTNGARDVKHFTIGTSEYLAFANWRGQTIDLYASIARSGMNTPNFVLQQTLRVGPASSLHHFVLGGSAHLAVSISTQNPSQLLPNGAQIYRFSLSRGLFQQVQSIESRGLERLHFFSKGSDNLLTLIEQSQGSSSAARTQVYNWNGTAFRKWLSLPTENASAIAVMDVPCALTGAQGTVGICSEKDEQRLIIAVNGYGRGSEIFSLFATQVRSVATHLNFLSLQGCILNFGVCYWFLDSERPKINQTLFPLPPFTAYPQADLYNGGELARISWDLPVQVDIQVVSQDSPVGEPYSMMSPASGTTSYELSGDGKALLSSVMTTDAGLVAMHVFNKYLSDLRFSFSNMFNVAPGPDFKLGIQSFPAPAISGQPFVPVVSVHDIFGNFKKEASSYRLNASLHPVSSTLLVYNDTSSTHNGVATFHIMFYGVSGEQSLTFMADGLESVESPAFNIVGQAYMKDLGALDIQAGASLITHPDGGVLAFGGKRTDGADSNALMKVGVQLPMQVHSIHTTGPAPPARFDHIALSLVTTTAVMVVLGGQSESGTVHSDLYSMNINDNSWIHYSGVAYPARARPSATQVNLIVSDPLRMDAEVHSLIVVFGGRNATGHPMGDIFILKAIPGIIENTLRPPMVSGDGPSARYGALMAWHQGVDKGYVMGGYKAGEQAVSDNAIYSFEIALSARNYEVLWTRLSTPPPVASPFPFADSALSFFGLLFVFFGPNTNLAVGDSVPSNSTVIAMNPTSSDEVEWLSISSVPDAILVEGQVRMAEISAGRALVVSGDFSRFTTRAFLLSVVISRSLRIGQAPASQVAAGLIVFPPPSVVIVDAHGDMVKDSSRNAFVRVSAYDSSMTRIRLGGITRVQAADGEAVFDFLFVEGGSSAHFVFEADLIQGVSSLTFDVMPGPLAKLSIVVAPFGVFKGGHFLVQPEVSLDDVAGKRILDNSYSLVSAFLEWKNATGDDWIDRSIWLTGENVATPQQGYVVYQDLGLSPHAAWGYYRFLVGIPGVEAGIAEFEIAQGAPQGEGNNTVGPQAEVRFDIRASTCANATKASPAGCTSYVDYANSRDAVIAGVPLVVQPHLIIKVHPGGLEFLHGPGMFYDVVLDPPVRGRSDLNGTTIIELEVGTSNFTDIMVNPVGAGYRLVFSSSLLPTVATRQFDVVAGTPASLAMPPALEGALAGLAFLHQPSTFISDAAQNLVAISVPVTANLHHPSKSVVLKGNNVANSIEGRALFTDLTIDPVDQGYVISFVLYDECCGASLDVSSPAFNVSYSAQASLEEIVHPQGAFAGEPFTRQPSVVIKDFGGNRLDVSGTRVTASIERDSTTTIVPPRVILQQSASVSSVVHFKFNMTEYLFVANLFDGSTYSLNSTLYSWDASTQEISEVQRVPTQGAKHVKHFVQANQHYVVVANSFEVVTIAGGVIEGTYNTQSSIYRMDTSGRLIHVASFPTHGAQAIETMHLGGTTMILVANNFNDTSTVVNSVLYEFNPNGNATHPYLDAIQELELHSASFFHYFKGSEGQDLVIGAKYYDSNASTYIAQSVVYRFLEGKFQVDEIFQTSGVVSIRSFSAGARKFVIAGNGFGLQNTSDPGAVLVYEHINGGLVVRQTVEGFSGLSGIEHFHANGAEWLVVTTDPKLAGSSSEGSSTIYWWDTSCFTSNTMCDSAVNFTLYRRHDCTRCGTTTHFESSFNADYVVSAGFDTLSIISFSSQGVLKGSTVAISVNGFANFTDLSIDLRLDEFSLSYWSENLQPAYGNIFAVGYGPISTISVDTFPISGIAAEAFAVQPIVVLRDLGGNLMPFQHDLEYVNVTISSSGAQPNLLRGSASAMIQNGRATFTDLGLLIASWHVLNFTWYDESGGGVKLFDSINVTVLVGPAHHMAFGSPSDILYGGMVFGQQPSFSLLDAAGNFPTGARTTVGVSLTDHRGFTLTPFTGNSDFEGLVSLGIEVLYYRDLAYVVAYGRRSSDNSPCMKLYKFGCDGLILLQTWNATVTQASLWNRERTAWLITVHADYSCQLHSFHPAQERFVVRGYLELRGVYRMLPIELGGQLHFVAAVDSSHQSGPGLILLASFEIPVHGNWSMLDVANWTLDVKVLQNITSTSTVSALKTFSYGYKEWLVVMADSALSLYRWGEYRVEYFHLHDQRTMPNPAQDMVLYLTGPGLAPVIAVAGQTSFLLDLGDDTAERGVSVQGTITTIPISASRVACTRKGHDHLVALISPSEVTLIKLQSSSMETVWNRSGGALNITALAWGSSHGSVHLLTSGYTQAGLPFVQRLADEGRLSGTTLATAVNGLVSFSDLEIDLVGNYTLSFAAVDLRNAFFSGEEFESYELQGANLTVQVGTPSALALASEPTYGITPSVKLVDEGGNDVATGAAKHRLTSVVYHLNISGSIVFDTGANALSQKSCILACRARFPRVPSDGMLWHLGGGAGKRGAWLGIRESATTPVLRVRVGMGDTLTRGEPSPNISYIDLKDFPRDGQLHVVAVEVALDRRSSAADSKLGLKLYIDGGLVGAAYMNSNAWVDSDLQSYGLRALDGQVPAGEPNLDWPAETSDQLHIYELDTIDVFCDERESADKSLLVGDWASGAPSSLEYVCCHAYYGCPKVTAVLDNPSVMSGAPDVDGIYSSGIRDVEHFTIGSRHYVAVANNFDGESYQLDSFIYEWRDSRLQSKQGITTNGAYDFEFFRMFRKNVTRAGADNTVEEHYLAVANHFHESFGYMTHSTIYKWNASQEAFSAFQKIPTEGATQWESFQVDEVHHLAVSNFFDGTFHSVDSVIYTWSTEYGNFTVLQRIPTMGAHSVRHYQHGGELFLFFAQFRAADEVSLATESVIYKWDPRAGLFEALTSFASSAAMHVEPFGISGTLYFAVANYANSSTDSLITDSTIFELSCSHGIYTSTAVQSIPTYGAAFVKHFTRGGTHYLGLSNWRMGTRGGSDPNAVGYCDGVTSPDLASTPSDPTTAVCRSSIDLYLWNGMSFDKYDQVEEAKGYGAFAFDVMLMDSRYYLLSAIVSGHRSSLRRLGAEETVPNQTAVGYLWDGPVQFPDLDKMLKPASGAISEAQRHWSIEFVSLPLFSASSGAYYNHTDTAP